MVELYAHVEYKGYDIFINEVGDIFEGEIHFGGCDTGYWSSGENDVLCEDNCKSKIDELLEVYS